MSGIVGMYCLDGRPVEKRDLERMLDQIVHRGPDGFSIWNSGQVGLGHRMLWTTPESLHEALPLVYASGELVVTADARIDNRTDLIPLLGFSDRPSNDVCDSELILQAYLKWGELCPQKLIGDFAFAIWDARSQKLFCARDPMGVKPFYYHHSNQLFAFGSEVRALLGLTGVPRVLNETRVADFLALQQEDLESTFFEGICRLPAAHCASIDSERFRKQRYWMLDAKRELSLPSNEAYADAMREVFTEAVRCRLRSAYPVGSLLSGGLDSSSIVCIARKILMEDGRAPLHTFSHIFPDLAEQFPRIDERPWIEAVVAQGALVPHYIRADRINPLEALLWSADEPLPIPNLYVPWFPCEIAQSEGLRVILDGYDGDTVVSYGQGYFSDLARSFKWGRLLAEGNAVAKLYGMPLRRALWQLGLRNLVPPLLRRLRWKMRGYTPPLIPYMIPIDREFARRVGLESRISAYQGDVSVLPKTARESHYATLLSGIFLSATEGLDKVAAVHSLEPRFPFLDRRVLEFCLAVPASQKLHLGWVRFIMRTAMKGILPDKVRWRWSKGNLGANIKVALLRENRTFLDKVILQHPESIEGYLDIPSLQSIYRRYAANPVECGGDELFSILISITLSYWLQLSGFA